MRMTSVSCVDFGANNMVAPVLKKTINRNLLKNATSTLKPLYGPSEVDLARAIVAVNVTENAAIAASMAQMPGLDEVALSANEIKMAIEIYNGVYDFNFSKTVIQSILMGLVGNRIGSWAFKGASKLFTWIPGLGNGLNATIASGTTVALGAAIINNAEQMDKARKRGEALDKFIKEMEKK